MNRSIIFSTMLLTMTTFSTIAFSQSPPPGFDSHAVAADRSITFRLFAPKAGEVVLFSSDIPSANVVPIRVMKKDDDGVWSVKVEPVEAGAYRYLFVVDGVNVVDPRNSATSETNSNVMSLVNVPGSKLYDVNDVPHGAVSEVYYHSTTLKRTRRMHVYTPPGYEGGTEKFPVLYLLHGVMDCDDAWSTVGRAGVILDNLIAEKKARPMIVVMPHGHTGPFEFNGKHEGEFERQTGEFCEEFVKDIRPTIEKRYRLKDGRLNRAIAGLSMGGYHTLRLAFENLGDYGYVGVFSSGIFGIAGGRGGEPASDEWEKAHAKVLDDAGLKKDLKLVWFGIGKDDFLLETSNATVEMLKKHGFKVESKVSDGGHTWINWRGYLGEFAGELFR